LHKVNYGTRDVGGKDVHFEGDAPKYSTIRMASEHPKITSYIPRDILEALDKWRKEHELESRNAAIVAILADYLGVQYPIQLLILHRSVSICIQYWMNWLDSLNAWMQWRMQGVLYLKKYKVQCLLHRLLPAVLCQLKYSGAAPIERTVPTGKEQGTAPSTVLPHQAAPLTQMALAKRLGCSDKAIEKHRKQGSKENFADWSRDRDPDNLAWTWEGGGGRGKSLRFLPRD
jgi:hypothetical protein